MRRISMVFVLALSLAAVATAGDVVDRDLCITGHNLTKRNFTTPNLSFDLYASGIIDVGSLIEAVNLTNGESAESIYAKANGQRQRLYPDEEIILAITIPEPVMNSYLPKTYLVAAVYWWNRVGGLNSVWRAEYSSMAATLCISNVKYGAYNIYTKVGRGDWIYRHHVKSGDSDARYLCGSYKLRGFKGEARDVHNKADIFMFFFE